MFAIFLKLVQKCFTSSLLLVGIGALLFSLAERQLSTISYEQFLLNVITDHYYLTYCITPIFLLSVFRNLEEDSPFVLIRSKTFPRYFFTKFYAMVVQSSIFVLLQVVIICIVGIGLLFYNAYPIKPDGRNEVLLEFAQHINTPLLAFIICALFMVVGLSVLGIMMQTMHHFLERGMVTMITITLYLYMTFGLMIPEIGNLPFISINHFIILHHNFIAPTRWIWTVFALIFYVAAAIILIKYFWSYTIHKKWRIELKGPFFYYMGVLWTQKNLLILFGLVLFITFWKSMNGSQETMGDFFIRFFYGQSFENFHMLSFLEQLIYNGAPLYIIAVFMEKVSKSNHLVTFIRVRHKFDWFKAILGNGLLFLMMYVIVTVIVIFLIGMGSGRVWNGLTYPIEHTLSDHWILQLISLKLLDLIVQLLGFLCLFFLTKNVTLSFLAILATNALILLPFEEVLYFPIGLGSVARLNILEGTMGIPIVLAFWILILCIVFLYIASNAMYKRFFN